MRIGIDLMGSDTSPLVLFDAVLKFSKQLNPSSSLVVVATQPVIDELSARHAVSLAKYAQNISFHTATDVITMSDGPLTAIRRKKGASLIVGIRLLKKRLIDALVTAANTGALIAASALMLPMLLNIKRPALLAELPTERGSVVLLDAGGNISCKADHLVQFGYIGAAYQRYANGVDPVKIGLLNIGSESKKGTSELRLAYRELQEHAQENQFQFYGNLEARDVFKGFVDVIVTDGFTGNIFLKSVEGVSRFILEQMTRECAHPAFKSALGKMQTMFHQDEYPGAIVCGIDGIIVKCHGNTSSHGLYNGIKGAAHMIEKQFPKVLR